jgi:hypothetical protein
MDLSDSLVNGGSAPANNANANVTPQEEEEDIDQIWLSSRTARQIYGLCQVEKVSARYNAAAPIEHKNNQMKHPRVRALVAGGPRFSLG